MSLGHSTSYLEFSSKCCHSQETDEKRRGSSVILQLLLRMILDVEKKTYLGGCRLFFQPGMMMMLLSWFFCHSSGGMSFFFCYLEDSSPGLQQRADSVPTSYYCAEETSRSTAGLQYPWREGFTAGDLYLQGWDVRSTGIPADFSSKK